MYILNILSKSEEFLKSNGVQQVVNAINNIIDIIRWVVPIGLIIMTALDIVKKVIDPDEKEGQKKIMNRLVAAVVVFLVPVFRDIVIKLVEIGKNGG